MHKFNTLKHGGGAVTLLPQHVAQRVVRHVSKRNGWNGIGWFGEEVQDNEQIGLYRLQSATGFCRRGSSGFNPGGSQNFNSNDIRTHYSNSRWRHSVVYTRNSSCRLFYYAEGGHNYFLYRLTEVAA